MRDADRPLRLKASKACETEPVPGLGEALIGAKIDATVGVALAPRGDTGGAWTWVECDVLKIRAPKPDKAAVGANHRKGTVLPPRQRALPHLAARGIPPEGLQGRP